MTRKKGLTIGKVRGTLYSSAKFLGDVGAVKNGTILQRVGRRYLGSLFSRLLSAIFRGFK